MMDLLVFLQGEIHQSARMHFSAMASGGGWTIVFATLPLGAGLGMVHALTPGHSKVLLASYLVSSELSVLRGLSVSAVLATTHVLSAVIIALFATELLSRGLADAGRAPLAEWISRGALVLIGLWLAAQALTGKHVHSRHEGTAFGFLAGLIPCPLTLFIMVMASARGIPLAGLGFAAAMLLGIVTTLGAVAALAVMGRASVRTLFARYGASMDVLSRGLAFFGGLLLTVAGFYELVA